MPQEMPRQFGRRTIASVARVGESMRMWQITPVQYFRLSVLLPLLLPIPLAAFTLVAALVPHAPDWLAYAAAPVFGAVLFGGEYLITIGVLFVAVRRRSWEAHAVAAAVAPVVMVGAIAAVGRISGSPDPVGVARDYAPMCLLIGYFYVAMTFAGFALLSRRGRFA